MEIDVNKKYGKYDSTLLHKVVCDNHVNFENVKFLVSNGADVNAKTSNGLTPLHEALLGGRGEVIKVVKCLVTIGADVNAKTNNNGYTPFHCATLHNGDIKIVKFLASKGADVYAKNNYGRTLLHDAALNNGIKIEVAKYFVTKGIDVNAKDDEGNTPLDLAKEKEHTAMVEYLSGIGGKSGK